MGDLRNKIAGFYVRLLKSKGTAFVLTGSRVRWIPIQVAQPFLVITTRVSMQRFHAVTAVLCDTGCQEDKCTVN